MTFLFVSLGSQGKHHHDHRNKRADHTRQGKDHPGISNGWSCLRGCWSWSSNRFIQDGEYSSGSSGDSRTRRWPNHILRHAPVHR